MSKTINLKLFKHDNVSTNTDVFDIDKALNENWDKVDEAIGNNTKRLDELGYDDAKIKQSIENLDLNKANKNDIYTKKEIEEKIASGEFKGRDGKDGTNGVDGKDGKSAYEISVKNGFVGTEEEWLASLVGEDGEKGEKGDTGERGQQGEKGDKGEQGIQGLKGDKGDKGDPRRRRSLRRYRVEK